VKLDLKDKKSLYQSIYSGLWELKVGELFKNTFFLEDFFSKSPHTNIKVQIL